MFRTKSDVERHIANCLRKIKGEEERNLRGCNFAQLYLKVHDYDSAKKYVTLYISAKKDSAVAYKVLGEACDGLKQKSQAYAAYKKSLQLEPNNKDILLRVCQLLCDPEIEFDPGVARHFLDKAVVLLPDENVVSKLKEKLFSDSTGGDPANLEDVLKDEIKARPSNADVRSKLLTLYVDSGRIKEAYLQSVQIESKQLHNNEIEWYKCINRICEAYYNLKDVSIIGDSAFYIHWIYALNRICALSLNEVYKVQDDLGNCSDYIFLFDQILWRAKQNVTKGSEVYQGFMKYMAAQLTFYLANLLIKQSRSLTNDIRSYLGILFLLSTTPPFTHDAVYRPSIKETHRKLFINLLHEGNCRYVQSVYILHYLGKDYGTAKPYLEFLEHKMKNDWVSNLMMKFSSEGSKKTSHFLSNANLKCPQSLTSVEKLDKSSYGTSFEIVYPGSLHHQVWLGLRHVENPGSILHCKLSTPVNLTFPKIQFTCRNLKNFGIDTFNQLDIESFLYASIFSASLVKDEYARDPSKLEFLPVDISSLLCTPEQAKWWKMASKPLSESGFKISDVTSTIQNGIRAVRGDRTPLPLLILMARAFSQKCNESNNDDIEHRAYFLWEKAVVQLENLNSSDGHTQNYYEISKSMFEYPKRIIPNEVPKLLNEGRYFIGQYLMKKQQYDEAVELLKPIRTPESFYCLAMIHKSLSEDESTGFYTSEITPEVRNRSVSLLIKAKEYCTLAQEMTNTNHNHPFYYKIDSLMSEIEEMLFKAENDQEIDNEVNTSIGSEGHMNGDSFKMSTPIKYQNYSRISNSTRRTFTEPRHRANCAELVELVGIQQSNSQLKMQQVLEQTRLVLDKLESLSFEQKTQRSMIDDLSSKFANMQTDVKNSLSEIRKEIKKTDLYNVLEDEDYSEEAVQYPNYQAPNYFQAQRVMQNNQGALNANLPGYIPPRTPEQIFQTNLGFIPYEQQQRISELLLRGGTIPPQVLNHKMQPPLVNMLPKAPTLPTSSQMNLPSQILPVSTQMNFIPSQMNLMPGVTEMNNSTLPTSLGLASFGTNTFQAPKFNMFTTQASESRGPTNVVITTSDTLPTGAPPVQPALSVTIPPQHRLGDTSHQFQISVPHTVQQPKQQAAQPESDDDNTDNETSNQEYDPIPDYKPIVTLSEVPVVTGEESEEPLFSSRARLYRFVENTWKERGIGIMKILKHKDENRARILMRREAVHKVCANHVLSSDMNLSPGSSPNTWIWYAQDFADEKLENEKFCIKFKTKEESDQFKEVFDKVKNFSSPKKDTSVNMTLTTPDSNSSVLSTPKSSLFSTPKLDSAANKTVLGGFTFSSTPTIKPAEEPVTSTPPKQVEEKKNVFGSFSFSSAPATTSSVETPKSTASGLFTNVSLRSSLLTNVAPSFSKSPETKTTASDKPFSNLFSTPTQPTTFVSGIKEQPKFTPPKSEAKIETKPLFAAGGLNVNTPKTTELSGFPLLKSSPSFNFSPMKNTSVFGSSSTLENTNTIFGSKETTKDSKSETPDFSALSQNKGALDFSTLAKGDSGFEFGKTSSVFGTSGFKGAGSKIFGSQFESEKPSLFSSMENSFQEAKNVETSQTDDDQSEFVPTASFKPVIDLPDEVQVVSGEENEIVLFEDRSKLFRFHLETHEWKERGIGKMKILKNEETGIVRLVMRREQVFKVCCNHRLTKDLELQSTASPNMYNWATRDFSEDSEKGQNEAFLIKFKTQEQALKFKEAFDKAKENLDSRPVELKKPEIPTSDKPPLSSLVKPGWTCSTCYINSDVDKDECPACNTPNPNKPAAPKAAESKFSFGIPPNENSATKPQSSDMPPLSSLVKPGWACSACYVTNDVDKNECVACNTPNPNKPAAPKAAESKFSFGIPAPTEVSVCKPNEGTPDKFVFGMKNSGLDLNQKSEDKPAFAFGSKPEEKPKLDFTFGSKISSPGLTHFKFSFQKDALQTFGQPAPAVKENESDDEVVEDEGDHIHFEPIIPLPAKVDLVTGEEDEDVLYVQRAKLFRFANETSEWKERGVGDVKILKHRTTKKIRIIMRRDNVKKLCLNHYLTPEIKMDPKDEKSWVWFANDYSENVMAAEKFAMRFKNEEIAQAFHDKILECQADTLSGDTSLAPSESQDEDVQITFVKEVTEELKQKALALQLPLNYYSCLDCEPCPGCRGCYSDEEEDEDDRKDTNFSFKQSLSFNNSQAPLFSPDQTSFNLPRDLIRIPASSVFVTQPSGTGGFVSKK